MYFSLGSTATVVVVVVVGAGAAAGAAGSAMVIFPVWLSRVICAVRFRRSVSSDRKAILPSLPSASVLPLEKYYDACLRDANHSPHPSHTSLRTIWVTSLRARSTPASVYEVRPSVLLIADMNPRTVT